MESPEPYRVGPYNHVGRRFLKKNDKRVGLIKGMYNLPIYYYLSDLRYIDQRWLNYVSL